MIAQTEDDYDAWVEQQQQPLDAEQAEFVEDGAQRRKWGCTACHTFNGVEA